MALKEAPFTRFAAYETDEVRAELDAQRELMNRSPRRSRAGMERLYELEAETEWRDAVDDATVEARRERATLDPTALPY